MIYNESKYNTSWKTEKLSDLGVFSRGISKHRPRNDPRLFTGGGYPLVQTGEIKEANLFITSHTQEYGEFGLQQSRLWDAGTLCITIAANIAETAILSYPMCFPDSVVGFQANKVVSSELFMYYVFDYIRTAIQGAATGSAQDNINIDYLTSLEFKIPSKEYQDKIVGIVGSLDRMILKNEQINDNLQQQLRLMYDYWFNQFDFPNEEGKPYRTSGGAMEWCPELQRKIPAGWSCVSLEDIIQKNSETFDFSSIEPTVDLSIMPSGSIALDRVNRSDKFSTNLFRMNEGDILFGSIRPYLKKAGIAPCNGVVAGTIHSFRVKKETDYNFALFTLCGKAFFDYAVRVSTGTKMPIVSLDSIMSYKLPYSESIVRRFNHIDVRHTICSNVQEMQKLAALRDWLLPMLMNGQATISD